MNQKIFVYIARAIVLLTAIPVHEAAHAWVSYKLGDPTARRANRLTLNPLRHYDILGCICMFAVGIGWAKPVPINPNYYKNPKAGMALSALAGPMSNLLMAFLGMILLKIAVYNYAAYQSPVVYYIMLILQLTVVINVSLSIFNLIPVPPFDGSRIFGFFLPEKAYFGIMKYERYIFLAVLALMVFGVFDKPLAAANDWMFGALDTITQPVDKIMNGILGLY